MKITDVTTTVLSYPHVRPVQDSTMPAPTLDVGGRSQLFVHIHTDQGTEGLGVGQAAPGVRQVVESTLRGVLIGQDPFSIEKLWNDMFWRIRGFGRKGVAFCALSAVDTGLWDLKAKAVGLPLYKLLGPFTESVPIYGSGGWTNLTEDELVAEMVGYVQQGIGRVKMKVGKDFGRSEREDLQRLAAVRRALGDDVAVYVDANNGYYAKQAIYMAKEFEQFQVGWFEEPVLADDIQGLAEIRQAINIPVATGEHEYSKYGFKDLITRGGADIVQPRRGPRGRRDRVDEGRPHGPRFQPARRSPRRAARSPSPGLRDAQPQGRRVPWHRPRGRPGLVHGDTGAKRWDVGAVPGQAWPWTRA